MNTANYGFTANTDKALLLGPGVVFINYGETTGERMLGATRGGNEFDAGLTYRNIDVDAPAANIKGLRRFEGANPTITTNLLELTKENLLAAIPGSISTAGTIGPPVLTEWDILTVGEIAATAYLKNVAFVGTLSGSVTPVVVIIKNALADGGFQMALSNHNEGVLKVVFRGYYDAAAPGSAPFELRWPHITP